MSLMESKHQQKFRISSIIFFLLNVFIWSGCQTEQENFDYQLGGVGAFSEAVAAGVKKIALSSPMTTAEMDAFFPLAEEVAKRNGAQVYREDDFLVTDLFPHDIVEDKEVIVIYAGKSLRAYQKLKSDQKELIADDKYTKEAQREVSRRFGRLLSYTPRKINSLLSQNTDYRVMDDFGMPATNVFLYYRDLEAASKFYSEVLGLEILTRYDNATILRVAAESYLILVDAAKGMHSADEPKTVALALITDELAEWYEYLKEQNVPIKYEYKPREGGPHDGFVAIDPEGYLLEFEIFKQHEENENFIPYLNNSETIEVNPVSGVEGLGFKSTITWLYYKDVLAMQQFYEDVMGLEIVADQGWTKIYKASETGFIGLVDERRGIHSFTKDKAVTVSFLVDSLDGWFKYAAVNELFELRSEEVSNGPDGRYRAFVGYDPEGYFLEFDRFYEHEDNAKLMEYLYNEN